MWAAETAGFATVFSKIPGSNVAGIDINKTELNQAKRGF
jgi:hypothetical protein